LSAGNVSDLILNFSNGDQITIQKGLSDVYQFDQYIFSDKTQTLAQLISTHAFTLSAGNDSVDFSALPAGVTVDSGAGSDSLYGSAGSDTFVLSSLVGSDAIGGFASGFDHLRISQSALPVGNGNTSLEGALTRAAAGGFATSAELVVFTADISGSITTSSAVAKIGSATSAYSVGQTALFVVDNGTDSALYYFKSAGSDAVVSSSELTLLATLSGAPATGVADYLFGA
jgi:hypothetical protein